MNSLRTKNPEGTTLPQQASTPSGSPEMGAKKSKLARKLTADGSMSVSTTLPPGLATRFATYCKTTERTGSGALRLFVRRMLDHEDF